MANTEKILYVKDFGAVGDGKTDDAYAIHKAIEALKAAPAGSSLVFEKDATYYYNQNRAGQLPVIYFRFQEGKTLKGENTTILLGGRYHYYADIENCKDITIEGFNFNYGEYKPAFHADFESIDAENGTAIMIADRDIHLENGQIYDRTMARELFACIKHPKSRWHVYVDAYEMLDKDARRFKVTFRNSDKRTMDRLKLDFLPKQGLVMMMPFSGNIVERAFSIHEDTNFTMRNVNIYSASRHVFSLQYNHGDFLFENVKQIRHPDDMDLWFVSWGDSYHLLQNRAHYHFKNCVNEWNYDDVFNISVSLLVPRVVYAPNEVDLFFAETRGAFAKILPGDAVTIVSRSTGQYQRTEIAEVISQEGTTNHVRFKDNITWLEGKKDGYVAEHERRDDAYATEDLCVYIDPLQGKDMIMENCNFDGTFRARNDISFVGCRFYNRRFWLGNETLWEGSLPKNIIFKDCRFEHDDYNEVYWHVCSHWNGEGTAHAENIVFDNCKGITLDIMEYSPEDEIIIK